MIKIFDFIVYYIFCEDSYNLLVCVLCKFRHKKDHQDEVDWVLISWRLSRPGEAEMDEMWDEVLPGGEMSAQQ